MQKNLTLSIIIPCYNCADTLEEAVASIYTQHFTIPYEVIMVDDGSPQKSTPELMKKLTQKYPHITCYFYDENHGGGAARNTGIAKASGDLIYCLDSDNILAPDSLQKMINFLYEKKCDGVAFCERRFFIGKNIKNYSSLVNTITDRSIQLKDIFNDSGTLLDNFLFTKKSYLKTKGFPEHHGFDTQSFEMRYLSADNTVYICKDSIFYHRQASKNTSYFEREYNAGNFSLYYYYCIEDIFELLSPTAQEAIMTYDVFANSSFKENISTLLKNLEKDELLFKKENIPAKPAVTEFARAIEAYRGHDFKTALEIFESILQTIPNSKILYYNILRCLVACSGVETCRIEKITSEKVRGLLIKPQRLYKSYHRNSVIHALIRYLKK